MDDRKLLILKTIIKEHVKTGAPVSSGCLVDKYKLGISPATVRNEMAQLEDSGYIVQPHTSAGRVPTELAYRLYLEKTKEKKLSSSSIDSLDCSLLDDSNLSFKNTAKIISQISNGTVFWAFHRNDLYYTGVSNLFQQPEFSQIDIIQDVSIVIDRMEEIIDEIFDNIGEGISTLIGSENPFGGFCSTIFSKYKVNNQIGMFGILGPMRMDYDTNIAIAKYINEKIDSSA